MQQLHALGQATFCFHLLWAQARHSYDRHTFKTTMFMQGFNEIKTVDMRHHQVSQQHLWMQVRHIQHRLDRRGVHHDV